MFVLFFIFFFFFHFFLFPTIFSGSFFSLLFKFFQQSLVRHVYFFQSLIRSLFFFTLRSIAHYCLLHFCFPSTSVLITSNFISPSLVISVITHFNLPQLSVARNQTKINVSPFFPLLTTVNGLSQIFSTAYEYPSLLSYFFLKISRVFSLKSTQLLLTQPTKYPPQNTSKSVSANFPNTWSCQNSAHILNI